MVRIYYSSVEDIDPGLLPEGMSEYRRDKLLKTKSEKARRQSIGAELLLLRALRDCFAGMTLPPDIYTGPEGKPLCREEGVFFSLSHSGGFAACAVADRELGLDIQELRDDTDKLAQRFFTAGERDYVFTAPDRRRAFREIWALKESRLKATGQGLKTPLGSFSVVLDGKAGFDPEGRFSFWHREEERLSIALCLSGGRAETPELLRPSLR